MIDLETYKTIVKAGAVVPRPKYVKGGYGVRFYVLGRVVESETLFVGRLSEPASSLPQWYATCHLCFQDVFKTLSAHERMALLATAARYKNARPTEVTDTQ